MHVPPHFAERDPAVLHDLIRRYDFGLLVTVVDGAPFASHLPFLLETGRGTHGTLIAHMARANPQWRSFAPGMQALVVFQGPHAYISPRWYDPARNAVPTWNYAVAHAYGTPSIVSEPAAVRAILDRLVATHEGDGEDAWRIDSQPERYVGGMMQGIVAFEICIDRLEGKFKLNQNHPPANRHGAIAGLRAGGDPLAGEVAALMAAREDGE